MESSKNENDNKQKIRIRVTALISSLLVLGIAVVGVPITAEAAHVEAANQMYRSDTHQQSLQNVRDETTASISDWQESVSEAKESISNLKKLSENSDGKVFAGDEDLLKTHVALMENLNFRIENFTFSVSGSNRVNSILSETNALKAIKSSSEENIKKINDSVAKETARIEEEKRKAEEERQRREAEAAAQAAREAASRAQSSASSSSNNYSGSSKTSGNVSNNTSSGQAATPAAPSANWSLSVSGYCADWSCIQSSVDSNGAAYIVYPGTGLVEIAGHNYGSAGIIANFQPGQTVSITGNGAGLYQITGVVWTFKGATTADVPAGFAFQTCVGSQMKLAYATKIG